MRGKRSRCRNDLASVDFSPAPASAGTKGGCGPFVQTTDYEAVNPLMLLHPEPLVKLKYRYFDRNYLMPPPFLSRKSMMQPGC